MDNKSRLIPAGMPFSRIKRSSETGSRLTGGLYGVFTKEAQMNPAMQEPSEQQNLKVKFLQEKVIRAICTVNLQQFMNVQAL